MAGKSVPVEDVNMKPKARRGRPVEEDRGEIILSNGLSARQWEFIKREAANKTPAVDAAWLQRFYIQIVIDAIEASRAGPVATPEEDQKFEKLVKSKSNHKSKKLPKE